MENTEIFENTDVYADIKKNEESLTTQKKKVEPVEAKARKKKVGFGYKIMFLISTLLIAYPFIAPGIGILAVSVPQFAELGIALMFSTLLGYVTVPIGILLLITTTFILWFRR